MGEPFGLRGPIAAPAPAPPLPPLTKRDRDALMLTLQGEVDNETPLAQQAVTGVILNRSRMTGRSSYDIVSDRNLDKHGKLVDEFDGFYNRPGGYPLTQADYDRLWKNVAQVENGNDPNPAGNATNYYSPQSMPHPGQVASWAQGKTPLGFIGHQRFYALPFEGRLPLPVDPAQPFRGTAAPVGVGENPNGAHPASPRSDLSPYLQEASYSSPAPDPDGLPDGSPPAQGGLNPAPPGDLTGMPPDLLADNVRSQPQGPLNAPPPGGLPTGMGDYLYGAGNPAAARPSLPLAALAMNARPPSQGVLNAAPSPMTAQVAPPTDADIQALGPENAAILSRLLAKPTAAAPNPLAAALMALGPGASGGPPASQV